MPSSLNSGALDGLSVLRFAHSYDSGGGTERYLDDVDRALLERNAMTVVRLHLTRAHGDSAPRESALGRGRLVQIALPVLPTAGPAAGEAEAPSLGYRLKQRARDWVLYNPLIWRAWGKRWTTSLALRPEPGQAVGAGEAAAAAISTWGIDLAVLHFFGGADADEVMNAARAAQIPTAVINHYSNDRFLHLAIRKHALLANAVSGVNGLELPQYVRRGFANLSDGIDTDFFRRDRARPLPRPPNPPVILLPARVIREKGQLDLVRAVASLRHSGLHCSIAFAGRVDSSAFVTELRRAIADAGLTESVHFLGNLTVEELRDWYAASAVVAFPTYHHEGLGRVIVEAQAMGVPVVAYATGGVPEGIDSGRTGYLLATGDVAGMSARLGELLAAPALRKTMGENGVKAAEEKFSLAALADRHEQFYRRVLADFAASRPCLRKSHS
jgi:glycosyltransferase involved in cell wall biosynthesis